MLERILSIKKDIEDFPVGDKESLEQYRLKYLSRKGIIANLFEEFKELDKDTKRTVGKELNELKVFAESRLNENKEKLESSSPSSEDIDLTLPARPFSKGTEHIITQTL